MMAHLNSTIQIWMGRLIWMFNNVHTCMHGRRINFVNVIVGPLCFLQILEATVAPAYSGIGKDE
jgi:hypothetical protein